MTSSASFASLARRLWLQPLARNAAFLMATAVITAGVGFMFWTLNANLFTPRQVGTASAMLSACGLVGAVSGLGFSRTLIRFLPTTAHWTPSITTMWGLSTGASVVVASIGFVVLEHLGLVPWSLSYAAAFLLTSVLGAGKAVLDNVFVAARKAHLTFAENLLGGAAKISTPFVFVGGGALGIVLSHGASLLVAVVAGTWFLRRLGHSYWRGFRPAALKNWWGFSLGSWITDLVGGLPALLLPVVVASRLGPSSAAYWYIALMIATFLYFVCSSIGQSLLAEVSHDEGRIGHHVRRASLLTAGVLVPAATVLILAAPYILRVFGPEYVSATATLRILLAATFLVAASYIAGTILNIYKRIGFIAVVNAVNAVIVLVPAALVVGDLRTLAVVWLLGEVVNAVGFVAGAAWLLRRSPEDRLRKSADGHEPAERPVETSSR